MSGDRPRPLQATFKIRNIDMRVIFEPTVIGVPRRSAPHPPIRSLVVINRLFMISR